MNVALLSLSSKFLKGCNISKVSSCSSLVACKSFPTPTVKGFHSSAHRLGLEEFFDNPSNFGKEQIKSGCSWSKDLLRRKSAVELHQLWFVLLKERNMLNTQEHYCLDIDKPVPGPDRLDKVAESMSNLRDVIDERESAKNMLLYGRKDKEGGEMRKSAVGAVYYHKFKEHLLPKEYNKNYHGDQPADIASFHPKIEEMHLRMQERREKIRTNFNFLIKKQWSQMRRSNPNLPLKQPAWFRKRFASTWKYGIHPRMRVFLNKPRGWDTRKYYTKKPKHTPERV